MLACKKHYIDFIRILLLSENTRNYIDLNATNNKGETCEDIAAYLNHVQVIDLIKKFRKVVKRDYKQYKIL